MVKINRNECKWFAILLGFTYFIYSLISTGKIYYFIHPKMVKYVKFSLVVFFILAIVQFKNVFKVEPHPNKKKISFFIFLLPLILGLYFNPQQLNSEVASKKELTYFTRMLKNLL